MYIKAGTILPLLDASGDKCTSLEVCYLNPITLQVYLDAEKTASGLLYLDDSISQNANGTLITFEFVDNTLRAMLVLPGDK